MRKFIRTQPASPPVAPALPPATHGVSTLKTNGHANGAAGGGGGEAEELSTLSRWWSESEEGGVCGALWEDAHFPASWRALGGKRSARGVVWRRPGELCARPEFRAECGDPDGDGDGARWTVVGGALGGAPLCVAACALALTPRLLDRAAPPQPRAALTGRYRFRFWEFGAWRDVWVDDRLPTRGGRPIGARSAASSDFTLPLLEKAYAKWRGGYATLRDVAGDSEGVAEALRALTGGAVQSFELARTPAARVLRALEAAAPRATLPVAWAGVRAVTVSGLARLRTGAPLLRIRSAAGAAVAGGGATWRALSPPDRELLAARADPGDCWLSFAEFLRAFGRLELVHVPPDEWVREPALHDRRPWRAVLARRRWRTGYNAGGAPPAATAGANPQFHLQTDGECHVVVSVLQRRGRREAVGFSVYAVPAAAPHRAAALRHPLRALDAPHCARATEVVAFFALPAGRYLVVPHARRAHVDAAFLLRILTDGRADVWEVNEDNSVVCGGALDLEREASVLPEAVRAAAERAGAAEAREGALEARELRAALRRVWRACLESRPSAALCRALAPLGGGGGALPQSALPALVARLAAWREAWRAVGGGARRCTYSLRAVLGASGARVSNKVLEALVCRFARGGGRWMRHEEYAMALARLHLAHARHSALEARHKASPVQLEEMILMTIYT